jgi:hypothetical protein
MRQIMRQHRPLAGRRHADHLGLCAPQDFCAEGENVNGRRVAVASVAAILLSAWPADAQWLKYPTPNVPRRVDGTPNLEAPAPRAADGRPDLAGVWQLEAPPCPPEGCVDYQPGPEFLNIAAKHGGDLPYQPWAAALVRARAADIGRDDPVAFCRPPGAVRILTFPPYRKFLQLPGVFVILSERDVTFRQIYTDGRALPVDPVPTPNGYSAGRWEGDTLVVETNGLRDGTWLDRRGNPQTDAATLTERFRRVNFGLLQIELTVNDPKAYTRPWTVTLNQRLVLDADLLDYHCTDNEKDAQHVVR